MTGNLRPRANRVKQLVAVAAYCLAAAVTELQTPRLTLHAIDTAEGERIAARRAGPEAGFRAAGTNGDLCLFEMRLDG